MAATVVLVNGLPGAGKTTLARQLGELTSWPARLAGDASSSCGLGAVSMETVWAAQAETGCATRGAIDAWKP